MEFNIQNYKELKGKTIFDFTKDEVIIIEIVGFNSFDEDSKKYYLGAIPMLLAHDIYRYACMVDNKSLRQAALLCEDELREEYEEMVNEAAKKGIIVD